MACECCKFRKQGEYVNEAKCDNPRSRMYKNYVEYWFPVMECRQFIPNKIDVKIIRAHYLKHVRKWSAYTTYKGYDYYELGKNEHEAINKLKIRLNA